MTGMTESHTPRPEFRARLEDEVLRTFHRQAQFSGGRGWSMLDPRRVRGVSLILAGLILGFSTEFASGQVQDARERSRLVEAADAARKLAALRAQLADESVKRVRTQYEIGVVSRETLSAAEADCREMEMNVVRLDLDLAETHATSAPPRNELWAPSVSGRDFVADRMRIDAALVQDRLKRSEQRLEELQRNQRVGVVTDVVVSEARAGVEETRDQLGLLAMKLSLRKEFLEKGLATEDVARRLQRTELQFELQGTMRALRGAEARLQRAKERARVGVVSELEVKRAEVEVLELSIRLKQLEAQYRDF